MPRARATLFARCTVAIRGAYAFIAYPSGCRAGRSGPSAVAGAPVRASPTGSSVACPFEPAPVEHAVRRVADIRDGVASARPAVHVRDVVHGPVAGPRVAVR